MEQTVVKLDWEADLRKAIREFGDSSEEEQREACNAYEGREGFGPVFARELRRRLGLPPKLGMFQARLAREAVKPFVQFAEQVKIAVEPAKQKYKEEPREQHPLVTTSLSFQHSKSPTGIPSSLENAIMGVNGMSISCRYDVFHNRYIIESHVCGLKGDEDLDTVCLKVREAVLRRFRFDPGASFTMDAVLLRARDNMFDPVRDYLDGLVWDGVKRIDNWLVKYCRAKDTPLNRAIGRKVLIAAVRRVKQPG